MLVFKYGNVFIAGWAIIYQQLSTVVSGNVIERYSKYSSGLKLRLQQVLI